MWYEVLLPGPVLMIPILVMTTKGTHSPKNDSNVPNDIIVTYTNHAEAHDDPKPIPNIPLTSTENVETDLDNIETSTIKEGMKRETEKPVYQDDFAYREISMTTEKAFKNEFGYKTTTVEATKSTELFDSELIAKKPLKETKKQNNMKKKKKQQPDIEDDAPEDVIFIPHQRDPELIRNEYYLQKNKASIHDLMGGHKTVEDLLTGKEDIVFETETPGPDIIFFTGKNNDVQDIITTTKRPSNKITGEQYEKISPKIDCTNLNCTNTIDSICGEKIDNYHPKLRLFLNECYFRKVNCNFQMASNRYNQVPLIRCQHIGKHYSFPPYQRARELKPEPRYEPKRDPKWELQPEPKSDHVDETRRSFSSRRSMSMNIDGRFCSHPCPTSCPELYEPECAVSSTGRHRVFVNHCALDHNSCSFGIVWHIVPLAECVGGKKAEMRQNAGFIGWMQRVGVVDKKGRLAYDVDRR